MPFVRPATDVGGLSLALLDAMGAGLCGLTSDLGDHREAIEQVGFTFGRDCVSDLADRLQFLIAIRPCARLLKRRRNLLFATDYQWSRVAVQIERPYFEFRNDGLGQRPQPGSHAHRDFSQATIGG
jgi:glycosyltransferase involved in cell wall biosynthesis